MTLSSPQQQSEDELLLHKLRSIGVGFKPDYGGGTWLAFDPKELMQLIKANREQYAQEQVTRELEAFDARLLNKMTELEANEAAMEETGDVRWFAGIVTTERLVELKALDTNKQETKQS